MLTAEGKRHILIQVLTCNFVLLRALVRSQPNRIIAALAGVTCVVEARWRSGAMNTAQHAETIARHVAAVPGSVHSANSAGCHRLLKEGTAALVTGAAELTELLAS